MLENVPGGYVIDGTEALRATPDAGYRSHRHELRRLPKHTELRTSTTPSSSGHRETPLAACPGSPPGGREFRLYQFSRRKHAGPGD